MDDPGSAGQRQPRRKVRQSRTQIALCTNDLGLRISGVDTATSIAIAAYLYTRGYFTTNPRHNGATTNRK